MKFRHLAPAILSVLALVGLASCGGGGGGATSTVPAANAGAGGSSSQPSPSTDTTGVVAIFLKDDPTDKYSRIVMHLTGVDLLGPDGKYTISDEEKDIDLLKLQNFYDMLAVSDKVPAGTYEKIRMYVQSIKLYYLDENGEEVPEPEEAEVPANGKVDLNPRGEFTVSPDTAIMIEIDIDARNSIKIHETGNGRTKFRPQVFVHIEEKEIIETLVRVSGTIGTEISTDPQHFDLCDIDVDIETDTDGCIQINVGADTRIFDEDGEPLEYSLLSSGQEVTVFGKAIIIEEEEMTEGDTVQMIQINAIVIQRVPEVPEKVLVSLNGSVLTEVNEDDTFGFQVFPGQDYPTEAISAILNADTKILNAKSLVELSRDQILPGRIGEVIGVSTTADPQTVKAALVLIKLDEPQAKSLNGVVGEVREDDTFDLEIDNEGTPVKRCVVPSSGALYFVLVSTEDGVKVIKADASAVKSGLGAAVFGSESDTECFDADVIVLQELPEVTPT